MDSNCVRTSRDGFLDGVHMHLHVDLDDTNCALDDMVKECLGWVGMVGWSPPIVSNWGIDVLDAHSKPDEESRQPKHDEFADLK